MNSQLTQGEPSVKSGEVHVLCVFISRVQLSGTMPNFTEEKVPLCPSHVWRSRDATAWPLVYDATFKCCRTTESQLKVFRLPRRSGREAKYSYLFLKSDQFYSTFLFIFLLGDAAE